MYLGRPKCIKKGKEKKKKTYFMCHSWNKIGISLFENTFMKRLSSYNNVPGGGDTLKSSYVRSGILSDVRNPITKENTVMKP